MRNLVLLACLAVVPAIVMANCSGSNNSGLDGGSDAGNNNQHDSGNGGNDSGNNMPDSGSAGCGDANYTGLAAYCSTADASAGCPGDLLCGTLTGIDGGFATGGSCTAQCTTSCGSCTCYMGGCYVACTPGGAGCAAGEVCAGLTASLSICIPNCTTYPDTCPSGTECNSGVGFCTVVGSGTFGGPCGGTMACGGGLLCLQFPGSASGFCSQACSMTNACPATPAGAQCDLMVTGEASNYCGWPCTPDAGTACPTGLTCQSAGASAYLCQ
jgi:hypothetical protein